MQKWTRWQDRPGCDPGQPRGARPWAGVDALTSLAGSGRWGVGRLARLDSGRAEEGPVTSRQPGSPVETEEGEDRRERILSAAADLFADEGYDATPTSRIAEQAGVPKGLGFYYFPRKRDVLTTLLEERIPETPGLRPRKRSSPESPRRAWSASPSSSVWPGTSPSCCARSCSASSARCPSSRRTSSGYGEPCSRSPKTSSSGRRTADPARDGTQDRPDLRGSDARRGQRPTLPQ
jgi:hypothetical protein